jgi:hypothetical protein
VLVNGVRAIILSIATATVAVVLARAFMLNDPGHDPSGGDIPLVIIFIGTMVGTCAGICIGAMRTWDRMETEFKEPDSNAPAAT